MIKKLLKIVGCVMVGFLVFPVTVTAISATQEGLIRNNCESIRNSLKNLQRQDARTRVYLGGYYEKILSDYVKVLNVRLVENNISDVGLIENQKTLAETKTAFTDDYVKYQQRLEELVTFDCKNEPKEFYEKLSNVRQKRGVVEKDVTQMRVLLKEYVELVNRLKEKL